MLLDSDAIVNPKRFGEPLAEQVLARAGAGTTLVLPDNTAYDGCSGVYVLRASQFGICAASLWCREVANNEYGLWDQSAMYSVVVAMWAQQAPTRTGVTAETCCWDQAREQQDKDVYPGIVEARWFEITNGKAAAFGGVTSFQDALVNLEEVGGVLPSAHFARLYSHDRAHGSAAGFVWHPAGWGVFTPRDETAFNEVYATRVGGGDVWSEYRVIKDKVRRHQASRKVLGMVPRPPKSPVLSPTSPTGKKKRKTKPAG
jgi:hypothetical protein